MSGTWKVKSRRYSDAEVRSAGDEGKEWGESIELGKGKGRRDSIMTGWIRIWYTFVGHRQHIHLSQHSRTVYSTLLMHYVFSPALLPLLLTR